VLLLDGLLLAVRSETLTRSGLRFDPQFRFHFYDMDFCRQAEKLGLSCGTWDLSVMHESGGNFASAEWQSAYDAYLLK
jgi:GT2 family glycosyltransferase